MRTMTQITVKLVLLFLISAFPAAAQDTELLHSQNGELFIKSIESATKQPVELKEIKVLKNGTVVSTFKTDKAGMGATQLLHGVYEISVEEKPYEKISRRILVYPNRTDTLKVELVKQASK